MKRRRIPVELTFGPFTIEEARQAGISWRELQNSRWRRLGAGYYSSTRLEESPLLTLAALHRRLPAGAAFSGQTAGWLHGLDLPPCSPVEVTVPEGAGISGRFGADVHRATLESVHVVVVEGLPVTSAMRTVVDLGSRGSLVHSVVAVDMALHQGLVELSRLQQYVTDNAGPKGMGRLRKAVDFAEPATESRMESRLRVLLLRARLPRPEAQVSLFDEAGELICRPDFLYREQRLALEFDGGVHRDQLVADNRRQNRLVSAGYRLLRFTSADVLGSPTAVVERVRGALSMTRRAPAA